ncbi:MAG TPA: Rpn family recombination-promoting nuclease/putative transposase [Hydrogenophilus thermoluteolus]|nr:Rpn family recombination-promoting nuclease/putative transposase [Hydrogenophilus thermoluteolus]
MLELTLRIDMERIDQQLAQLPRHAQVGIAEALTRTALDARDAVRETPPQRFTLRRPWVAQGIGALPATPRRLVAVVYSRDRFMALRLLVYVGLLYQDLVKRGELTATGQLPPVLPIVLYNGTTPWREAESLAELVAAPPQGLEAYLPQLRYLLIDENRYDETTLASQRNLAAALFRLEQSRTPEQLRAVLKSLIAWLSEPEQKELRRSLTIWIARLLRRKIRSEEIATVTDLLEIDTMLAERIESWTQQWMLQGLQKGKAEGEALALKRLLAKRFGPLPAALEARIAAASLEEIEAWFDAAITAPSLDAVFGSNPQ